MQLPNLTKTMREIICCFFYSTQNLKSVFNKSIFYKYFIDEN